MCQCRFVGGNVSIPGWSQTHYASLGTILEGPRPKSCNAGSGRTGINTSYCGTVIGFKKIIKITSFNTTTIG